MRLLAVLPAVAQLPQGFQRLGKGLGGGGGIAPQDPQGLTVPPGRAGADDGLPVPELLQQLLEQLRDREAVIRARTARRVPSVPAILRGNPSATAKAFSEALESRRSPSFRRDSSASEKALAVAEGLPRRIRRD